MAKRLSRDPDLRQLRGFYAVARSGGFGRAERLLSVQQPAISKMIRDLESKLGGPLFTREHQGSTLTPMGERLVVRCERIFAELAEVEQLAESLDPGPRGELRIAANEHVAAYLLAPIFAELRRSAPGLTIRAHTGPAELLSREIAEGGLELGLFFRARRSPKIEKLVLAKVPCQLVAPPGGSSDRRVLESFIGSREIDDVANRAFPTLEMLQKKRPATAITLSCNSLEAHKRMVKEGCGVSILPRFMIEDELRRGELVPLHPEYEYLATLELLVRRGRTLSKNAHALLTPLKRSLRARGW